MGLIKSNLAPTSAVPFSMQDVEVAARNILLRARQQADQLLAAAQTEGEVLKKRMGVDGMAEGRKAGYEQGLVEGQKQAMEENRSALAEVHGAMLEAVGQLEQSREELTCVALAEVVGLAAAIARRVTKRQAIIEPEVLEANVADALRLVIHAADLRIAVNPSQLDVMERLLPRMGLTWPVLNHAKVVGDGAVHPGGCRLMTAAGEVDADIDGQLDRVIGELLPTGE